VSYQIGDHLVVVLAIAVSQQWNSTQKIFAAQDH
jgi:hypothetical protein